MILDKVETPSGEGVENYRQIRAMDGNISIYVDPAALQTLELMVRESVNAIRGRGVEMGGLVLGRPLDWDTRKLVVTGFTPVEIEYRYGPSFRASVADLETFAKSAAEARAMPIGCFRTQVRTGMLIRDDDLQLVDALFGDRDCCFIPIEATVTSPSLLNLHLIAPNRAPRLVARFPIKQPRNGSRGPELPQAAEPVSPEKKQTEAEVEPLRSVPQPEERLAIAESAPPPTEARRRYRWILLSALVGLGIAGSAFFLGEQYGSGLRVAPLQFAQRSVAVPEIPLDLQIVAVQSGIEVRWSKDNSGVAKAARGLLVLFDGPEPKRIELNPTQIRSGVYTFQARSTKITAWLTVYQTNGSFLGETKEVLVPLPSAALVPNRDRPSIAPQVADKATPVASNPPSVAAALPAEPPPEAQPWIDHRPVSAPEPVRAPDLPEPPPIKSAPVTQFQPPSMPVPSPQTPGLQYKGSVVRAVPARLLRQVTPAVPADVAAKLRTEVQLEISVSIDPTGRVTGARVLSSQGAFASLLSIEVLKAAQLCQFAPAQEDGHPAAGSAVLTFRFAPKSH